LNTALNDSLKGASSIALGQQIDLIFETSWEVCNKVGGIYAVLSTKAQALVEQFGDKLIFVGPDLWSEENPSPYFKERKSILKSAASRLKLPYGITFRTGRWNVPGNPQVILVNPGNVAEQLPAIYGSMWEKYGVDSLHSYGDYEESCAFSVAAAVVMDYVSEYLKADKRQVIAHFNEWTTGMGLLYLQVRAPKIASVFTTHATSIGRSICGNGKPLYQYFHFYDGDGMAEELNMQSKHSLEKAAAHAADCFTTVSEVTARECAQLLRRPVDVVTPNGFEPEFVPKTVKYNRLRREGRQRLFDIAKALTGKEYPENTLLIATSGRHEYRNKGLDMFIDAIAQLGERMPQGREALAFIFVPAWTRARSAELQSVLESGFPGPVQPDYLTHRLHNENSDEVCVRINQLKGAGALKKVKIIYVPTYLDGNDGVVNISYYDILPALDLTIFPSYYEPWGYTPLESVAFGVPTITDNKAGFGQWVIDNFRNGIESCGVKVVEREDTNYHETCQNIVDASICYINSDANARLHARNMAFLTSGKADWKYFIEHYDTAFRIALSHKR
jgi:glycosyltransferase involved in cell wall biosynthesis